MIAMTKYLLIAAGGAFGSMLRFALQGWVQKLVGGGFPFGTVAVNMLGCFVIGLLAAAFAGPVLIREDYRLGLTAGFLGGFTTFSAFGLETVDLLHRGHIWLSLANVLVSVGLGCSAVWGGYRMAQWWFAA